MKSYIAFLMASYLPKGVTEGEGQDCEVTPGDPIEITCRFQGEGPYLVTLLANKEQYGRYEGVARQLVNRR